MAMNRANVNNQLVNDLGSFVGKDIGTQFARKPKKLAEGGETTIVSEDLHEVTYTRPDGSKVRYRYNPKTHGKPQPDGQMRKLGASADDVAKVGGITLFDQAEVVEVPAEATGQKEPDKKDREREEAPATSADFPDPIDLPDPEANMVSGLKSRALSNLLTDPIRAILPSGIGKFLPEDKLGSTMTTDKEGRVSEGQRPYGVLDVPGIFDQGRGLTAIGRKDTPINPETGLPYDSSMLDAFNPVLDSYRDYQTLKLADDYQKAFALADGSKGQPLDRVRAGEFDRREKVQGGKATVLDEEGQEWRDGPGGEMYDRFGFDTRGLYDAGMDKTNPNNPDYDPDLDFKTFGRDATNPNRTEIVDGEKKVARPYQTLFTQEPLFRDQRRVGEEGGKEPAPPARGVIDKTEFFVDPALEAWATPPLTATPDIDPYIAGTPSNMADAFNYPTDPDTDPYIAGTPSNMADAFNYPTDPTPSGDWAEADMLGTNQPLETTFGMPVPDYAKDTPSNMADAFKYPSTQSTQEELLRDDYRLGPKSVEKEILEAPVFPDIPGLDRGMPARLDPNAPLIDEEKDLPISQKELGDASLKTRPSVFDKIPDGLQAVINALKPAPKAHGWHLGLRPEDYTLAARIDKDTGAGLPGVGFDEDAFFTPSPEQSSSLSGYDPSWMGTAFVDEPSGAGGDWTSGMSDEDFASFVGGEGWGAYADAEEYDVGTDDMGSFWKQGGPIRMAGGGGLSSLRPPIHEGDFVIAADVVSGIGDGSSDFGVQRLSEELGISPFKAATGSLVGEVRGPGSGLDDLIQTTIGGKTAARVANQEFLVPMQDVAKIGNGSIRQGQEMLYKLMDAVRNQKTGGDQPPRLQGSLASLMKG
jgi:hypothetical protein